MNRASVLLCLVAAAACGIGLSVGGWAWLASPVALPDVPAGKFQCLSYTPASEAGSPLTEVKGEFVIPDGLIERDMAVLAPYTDCVRTYSSVGKQGDVLPAAAKVGIKVLLGMWISTDDERNQLEIESALALAHKYPDAVRALVVGNEVLLRREMLGDRLAATIRAVKARTHLPVTYADIFEFWRRNPMVGEAVDVALVHILPYWDDPHPYSIDDVFDQVVHPVIARAHQAIPNKPIIIGEIGWPSAGRTRSQAVPSLVNQARFVRTLAAEADSLGVGYNLIEAIDQPWKRIPEGTVGAYWGILDRFRVLKFPLTGPVREWPDWRTGAGVGIGGTLLALALGWWRRRKLTAPRWIALGVAGAALGSIGWMVFDQLAKSAAGWLFGALKSGGWAIAAALGAVVLIGRLLEGRAWPSPVAAPIAEVAHALARRKPFSAAHWLGLITLIVPGTAAVNALLLAIDGRHRDFPNLAYAVPAFAFLVTGVGRDRQVRYAEEGWLAAVLIVAAIFSIDHYANLEAWGWAIVCCALAAPWMSAVPEELVRLARALGRAHQA